MKVVDTIRQLEFIPIWILVTFLLKPIPVGGIVVQYQYHSYARQYRRHSGKNKRKNGTSPVPPWSQGICRNTSVNESLVTFSGLGQALDNILPP
jgi:hypothetical protein